MSENLFGADRATLSSLVTGLGEPDYRSRQIFSWLYKKRARSIAAMSDLGKPFRERLEADHGLEWPKVQEKAASTDGTIKYLFRLDDGADVEAVLIPGDRRRTICISTQAGCPLKCAFCLTGILGYKRNLRPWEILGQVALVTEEAPRLPLPWNIVVMGMGEPLLNYEATVHSLRILMDPEGFAISPKKLTLSTVGILPALERLMTEPVRPNLAISLHAANATLRRRLMPIEEKYPLQAVIAAAQRYPIPRGGRVTYEYVLLGGVNDSTKDAKDLVSLLGGTRAKVNLIPLNPAPEIPFKAPKPEAVEAFCQVLASAHLTVSVRRSRGQDILAACGQLHLRHRAETPPVAV
jgi:23S rRNA (adenine2503-C2)-methyltransferase